MMNVVETASQRSIRLHSDRAMDTIQRNVKTYGLETIVQPSPSYQGFWARDTMIIALALMDVGYTGLAADLLRTWATYQIRKDDDPGNYVLLNKHRLNWTTADIEQLDSSWLEENQGGLPTCVYLERDEHPDGTREIYSCHPDPDGTAWWLVACAEYVSRTGDRRLAFELRTELQAAMDALVLRDGDRDLLVEQCPNEDWADHMRRHGKVTYTQAVWLGAVQGAATLDLAAPEAGAVRSAIRARLFTRLGVPLDWQCPNTRSDRLAQDSALLVLMGVVSTDEGHALLQRLDRLATPKGHRVVAPAFRKANMGPYQFKVGEYQNGAIWSWLSGWEAQARAFVGDHQQALELIDGCFCPGCDRIYEWINPLTGDRYNADFATGAASVLSAISML